MPSAFPNKSGNPRAGTRIAATCQSGLPEDRRPTSGSTLTNRGVAASRELCISARGS